MASRKLLPVFQAHLLLRATFKARHPIANTLRASSGFQNAPSPPRLPPEQQAEFERLQRAALSRLAEEEPNTTPNPRDAPLSTQQPSSSTLATSTSRHVSEPASSRPDAGVNRNTADKSTSDEDPAGGVWRGAPPEFEGDVNPKTGEVGGPKVEPLRWGSKGDWSYNGRVTDF